MSMFSTGLSGLSAAQSALNTTSNNISNVFTPGYNRELTQLGEGSAGTPGVQVDNIERQFNRYVADQLNSAKTQSSALQKYSEQVTQIDNLLADRDAGLAPLMQNFFSSLEDMASAPSDPAARQGVLGATQTLSAQFRSFDGYLQDMQSNINSEIEDEVTQINNTSEQVAGLNREIALARARTGEAPNSLLNQRDKLVSDLNERMDLRLNIQDGKTYNISLPNGQPLVTGTDSFTLEPLKSELDPQRTVVGYRDGGGNLVELEEDVITGGELGGLMSFRQETLDKTQNQIGQLAVSLSVAFNEQHKQGVDLNGEQGEDFFDIRQPQAYSYDSNSANNLLTSAEFDVTSIDDLRATDYSLTFADDAGDLNPVITRTDNGQVLDGTKVDTSGWDESVGTGEITFGGVTIAFNSGTSVAEGDTFEIQPVRRAGAGMEANIADLDKIAAGSFEIDQSGSMAVSDVGVTGANAFANTNQPLGLQLSGNELTITGFTGSSVRVNGEERALTSGVVQDDAVGGTNATLADGDEVTVDGVTFTIDDADTNSTLDLRQSVAASGDNRNALALQDLQSQNVVGGSSTVSGAYGSMVSDVGNRTNITQVNLDARQGLTDQLRAVQQSESGVNLDEEAANLIRYQQYYQANAKVIDSATTIMDTILGLRG
ncbi:flagellar hook-associated protein FlgK [Halomonas llamarensis]|uniref:Flagellar hook-associated protein 1 n=1 Tax=Halomonas llamarensis TaxID=2945104 RepID=A0ABT0SND3_9GAMM|nr:flagellar hook-associated protein FlgK [Halomonas llamarensis]MCL7929294.1 flagellar hook-associated protein FlgK [Halomonas llamarensis]